MRWQRGRTVTPTRIQMEAVECGAVALGIVLDHFGHHRTVEELREACGVSRDGVSAGSIRRAAQRFGLDCEGVRVDLEHLAELPAPAILHWEFNHFVVFEGVRGDTVYLNDPAIGPRTVTLAEADAAFTGIALMLARGADFTQHGARPTLRSMAADLAGRVRGPLLTAVLISIAMVVPGLLGATFAGVFTDRILIEGNRNWWWPLAATMGIVALLRAWTTWQREQLLLAAQTSIGAGGSLGFLWHAMTLPMAFFTHRHAAEVGNRIPLNDAMAGVVVHQLAGSAIGLVTMLLYGLVMMLYDPVLTALAFAFAAASVIALAVSQRVLSDGHRKVLVEEARAAGLVNRSLATLEEAHATGTADLVFARVAGARAGVISRRQVFERNGVLLQAVQQALATVALVAVLMDAGHDVMAGIVTVGMMLGFQGLMSLFIAPVAQLVAAGSALQDVRGNLERLDDVTRHPRDPVFDVPLPETHTKRTASGPRGRVQFHGVRFQYGRGGHPLIEALDLDITPGSRVAIVGGSGSGKSTIARLLVGQQHPVAGAILLDGEPLATMPREVRFARIAHVDQDVRLFSGTVRENLTLWDPAIPAQALEQAIADAGLAHVIARRAGGMGATLTENGRNLSGGERQRLEIARALATDADVLVLDEATSALDPASERAILEAIIARGRTLVFISHRLAPLALFDRIVVIEQGRVVQDGTPAALAGVDGPFRVLSEH